MNTYKRIRDLREDADMTQKQVAEKLFMQLTQYRRYECGESELPMNIAISIAKIYDVSLDYIAGLTNDKRGLTRSTLPDDETGLIKTFEQLNNEGKFRLLERADVLLELQRQT